VALIGVALAASGSLNLHAHLRTPTKDIEAYRSHSLEASLVGEAIVREPGATFYLAPSFFFHPTVQFTAYRERSRVRLLDWEALWGKPLGPGRVRFILEEGKGPTLAFLEKNLPGGEGIGRRDPFGRILFHSYSLEAPREPFLFRRGLWGAFHTQERPEGDPARVGRFPLINLTQVGDLGATSRPFSVRWEGRLLVPRAGDHVFRVLGHDPGRLWIGGRTAWAQGERPVTLALREGPQELALEVSRREDPDAALPVHLLWKRPGSPVFEPIPNTAFGDLAREASKGFSGSR
jgi:hypothetical protein